jgi:phosphonatase-like hydrolase
MTAIRLVVFDMAGTTVADRGDVLAAFDEALAAAGLSATPEQLAAVRGAAKREAFRTLVGAHTGLTGAALATRSEAVYQDFRARLEAKFRNGGVVPIAGAEHSFDWLRARGIRIALNTGFEADTQRLILAALGWERGRVDATVCGDDVPAGRPAPYMIFRAMERAGVASVHEVMAVGDTELDLRAGWNAGVAMNVGVLSGAHGRDRLERAPHTHLVDSVADLPQLLA